MRYFLLIPLMLISLLSVAADGMQVRVSDAPVNETMNRLEQAVKQAGFTVMARINHAAAAQKVDLELQPTELLIFGKPKAGTLLMQASPSVGLDLPLKYLVWRNAEGKVQIGWNDPSWLKDRHAISGQDKVLNKMAGALSKFAEQAAKK
jgi:uncharacterized protein (DUF302 family)